MENKVISSENTTVSQKKDNVQRIYFPELDGLRFLAFLIVFLHHHPLLSKIPGLSFIYSYGYIGVDLFFALSAFLFTKLLIAEFQKTNTISFKKFYIRRIFRIWPIFFLFIIFSVGCHLFFKGPIDNYTALRIFGFFTFSDNIFSAIYGFSELPYTSHLWTITYEEQFYIFIPLIILFLVRTTMKNKMILLFSIIILFSILRIFIIDNQDALSEIWVLPITRFESIILGIVIGFGGFDFLTKRINANIIAIIAILFAVSLSLWEYIEGFKYWLTILSLFIGLATSLFLFAVIKSEFLKKIFSINVLVYLGKRSYGLYLYHMLGLEVGKIMVKKISFLPANDIMTFIISMTFTIVVSIISYKIIETPFLKIKKRFEVIVSRPI